MTLKDMYIRFVPQRIRRLRHIVSEGLLFRYLAKRWKYLWRKSSPDTFPYYFVIAAIIKNEAPYIAEWIEFHLLQGVEKYIFMTMYLRTISRKSLLPILRMGWLNIYFGLVRDQIIT